ASTESEVIGDSVVAPNDARDAASASMTEANPSGSQSVPTTAGNALPTNQGSSAVGLAAAATPLESEIEAAYRNYLVVYSKALRDLDASHLNDVLDGRALQLATAEVEGLKSQHRQVAIAEDDQGLGLSAVTETSATVINQYVSR